MQHVTIGFPEVSPIYLQQTTYFDFNHDRVKEFANRAIEGASTNKHKAIKLFYAVRDQIRYDPYSISLNPKPYKASEVLINGRAYCLPKANLLVACARRVGIPTGIGLSDVYNHLCTPRLRHMMGEKELFLHHGYAVMHIENKWIKAAPAFNIELCTKFNVLPTEFDGENDALFQPYDTIGRLHMEYNRDHGIWSDFPMDRVAKDFKDYYPSSLYEEKARAKADKELKAAKNAFEEEKAI
ncbi:MAG: transglutaminase [Rhodospirillaceae bacterium]|nr:transglutaminase [Rhodospirillaceae bacterium]|tara:strand:+ start:579 stop:1298 length:720 start_codon:yes stop_codon:yes gene_type:complete